MAATSGATGVHIWHAPHPGRRGPALIPQSVGASRVLWILAPLLFHPADGSGRAAARVHAGLMDSEGRITDQDLRAARELLRWTQVDLAERSGVGVATIRRFETGAAISDERRDALRAAMERAGMVFFGRVEIDGAVVAGGVALRPSARPEGIRKAQPYRRRQPPVEA